MKHILCLLFFPFALWAQSVEPPVDFHRGPAFEVDRQIRNEWMDGPKALAKEAMRNEQIAKSREFPLIGFLIFLLLAILCFLAYLYWDALLDWTRRHVIKPPTKKQLALEKLKTVDQSKDWNDRYNVVALAVREGLEDDYAFAATESTHEEVLAELVKRNVPNESEYRKFFDRVGKVQYQRRVPSEKEYREVKTQAKKLLVKDTAHP